MIAVIACLMVLLFVVPITCLIVASIRSELSNTPQSGLAASRPRGTGSYVGADTERAAIAELIERMRR